MSRRIIALLAFLLLPTTAFADCNPPPPGLSINQWANLCENEINYYYNAYGGGMNYDYFVENLYGMYVNASQGGGGGGGGGVTPMAQCSPEGSTQCNSSGWQYTCTNGQWLTGSVRCGG